jgi:putative hydrolase of the HAD superfamily
LALDSWFQSVTISTQVGSAKPEAKIFEAALAKHRYRPSQAWHVGDSWSEDYEGSVTAGLQGIWLNRDSAKLSMPNLAIDSVVSSAGVLEISDLTALKTILHAQN